MTHSIVLRPGSRRALLGVFIAAILAAGYLVWSQMLGPVSVLVVTSEANVPEQVFGLGTVGARVQSNLGFKLPGVLVELMADQGDHVHAGQVLARLDARDVEAQLAVTRAGIVQAQANIDKAMADVASASATVANTKSVAGRSTRLVKSGAISEEQTETDTAAMRVATANLAVAESEVAVAQAALRSAEAQEASQQATLSYYTLSAPYDGWIVSRNLELGSMPNPGQTVFTVVAADTVWVQSYVDERLAGRLSIGQPATIRLRSEPSRSFPGHVARIEVQSDQVNEERLVDVVFNQTPPDIHLAEQAEVKITANVLPSVVAVPPSAVVGHEGVRGIVWTVEAGHLARRPVTLGPELLNGRLPILDGLPDEAKVVAMPVSGMRVDRAAQVTEAPRP